ncbi:MAG TPA: GNAT family N-acetyltransferase [Sphingomicrobium sp.]|jgi:GNAT superfamily N-acetyltransferase|nr:GNAT family N-acetyltransferase [Sphingomicrobium sp.]
MSDDTLDDLAQAARNRGLKLVRSRVRTPTKRRFGKVGLTDKSGKAVFGMDSKGPAAKPEEVEDYLRNLGARDWGASLDVAVIPRKRKRSKIRRDAANDSEPEPLRERRAGEGKAVERKPSSRPEPKPRPEPEPQPRARSRPRPTPAPTPKVREAKAADAPRLVELIHYLGHEIDEKALRKNLKALKKTGETPLVATLDKKIVGMCGVGRRVVIHRPAPLGRITALVVSKEAQGHGIGRMLVEAAEEWMRKGGCKLVEVTSNDRRTAAHAFYRHLGYERSSIRFFKKLK